MDVTLPDGTVINGVPDGTTREQLLGKLQLAKHPAAESLMRHMASEQATADTSGVGKYLAGAGKSVADLGLGTRQIAANIADYVSPRQQTLSSLITGRKTRSDELQGEVDETKARDSALMNSGSGMAGNITGNIAQAIVPGLGAVGAGKALAMPALQTAGKYALTSPLSIGGAVTQGTLGAAQAGLQPVASGENRSGNSAIGFAGGAAIPILGMLAKGAGAVLEPMYQSGRENIMGRTLRRVVDGDVNPTIANLRGAKELVPGSLPTAGQAGGNAGLAAMERAAFASEPAVTVPVAQRLAQQNEARVAALRGMSQGGDAAEAAREAAAGPLYKQARTQGIDQAMAAALKPQLQNLTERMPQGVLDKAKELARLNGEAFDKSGSVNGLHWIKTAVDDMISGSRETGMGTQTKRALTQFKSDLLSVVDELSPSYKQARETYAGLSRPVNQSAVAEEIAKKSIRPLDDTLTPSAYARALSDDTAARATGFQGSTLANTMEQHQLNTLNAIKDDLARSRFAETAGRGVGSDTVQKMAYNNLMQQSGMSGLPNLLSRPVQLAEYLSRTAYSSADREMRKQLAEALLDPKKTAELMTKGMTSERAKMLSAALRSTGPLLTGSVPAMLDARQ